MRPALAVELEARVRDALAANRVSQVELARRIPASTKHVSYVLNGRSDGSVWFWDAMLREAARP